MNITKNAKHNFIIALLVLPVGIGLGHTLAGTPAIPHKEKAITVPVKVVPVTPEAAQKLAKAKLNDYGWKANQFVCLNNIWTKESHWNYKAVSKTHDHGIPQRNMPDASKKEIHKFMSDPVAQINWGLNYISARYKTPCKAWSFWQTHHWY